MNPANGSLIVTGASRGIGAAIAKLVARRGIAVAVNYSRDQVGAAEVVDAITRDGGRAVEAVAWQLSPAASYVTGTILEVGGGR